MAPFVQEENRDFSLLAILLPVPKLYLKDTKCSQDCHDSFKLHFKFMGYNTWEKENGGSIMRILMAEDEVALAKAVGRILERNNYSVDLVHNGIDALQYLAGGEYDLAILDIMMPGMDGISVLQKIRQQRNPVPVILLTAKAEIDDKVSGLDSGANDYITKPFDTRELLARIRVLTRGQQPADSKLRFGNVSLDRANFVLSTSTGSFRLANKEYQMMEMLMSNPGILISSERFMEKIWGYETDTEINVVWVYISYLRKKLAAFQANIQIRSSRNAGYSLEEIR